MLLAGERSCPSKRAKTSGAASKVPESQIEKFERAGSATERIDVLQESLELRRQFLGSTSFAARAQAFVEQLVSGDERAVREIEKARKVIKPIAPAQIKRFEKKVGTREAGKVQPVQTTKQASGGAIENFELDSDLEAWTAMTRDTLQKTFEKNDFVGPDFLERGKKIGAFHAAVGLESFIESCAPFARMICC